MTSVDYNPAEHYDRVTEAWRLLLGDELHYGVFDNGDEPLPVATGNLTTRMIQAAELTPGLRLLDVGCGSGAPACRLVADHDIEVVGITTSEVGVETARARAAALNLPGATFEQRDGTDNKFADESFDRVWALESSHLMRDREALISECARVLRPGGRFILCDLTRQRDIPFEEVRARREDFIVLRTAFGDARMEPLEYYTRTAEAHGLVVDRADDLTALTLPTFEHWRANARQYRAEAVAALGEDGLDAFVRGADILEGFWRDGTLGYGLFSAYKPTG